MVSYHAWLSIQALHKAFLLFFHFGNQFFLYSRKKIAKKK